MINIYVVLAILFIHWVADFVLQTDDQAKNKSKSWIALIAHTGTYSGVWFLIYLLFSAWSLAGGPGMEELGWSPWMGMFPIVTLVCHTITDYFTSRLNSKLYAKGDVHNFFVSIGFDQWLHAVQLLVTYQVFCL